MDNTTPSAITWPIVIGFILSCGVAVVSYLDTAVISHGLAVLLLLIINLASYYFHLNVVGNLNTQIAQLKNQIAINLASRE